MEPAGAGRHARSEVALLCAASVTSAYGRDYRLGYSLGALGGEGTTVELDVDAQREERVAKQTEVEGLRDRTDIARGRVSQTTFTTHADPEPHRCDRVSGRRGTRGQLSLPSVVCHDAARGRRDAGPSWTPEPRRDRSTFHTPRALRPSRGQGGERMAWWRTPSAQTPRSRWNQDDYHTAFAATSKAQIEQGVAPWQTPWTPGARRRPANLQTGTPYRGGNAVYLSVTQTAKGYRDHRWATYKQLHDRGGQVRTGEQATHVLFYKFDDQPEKAGAAEQEQTRPPMVRVYAVFNVEQADYVTLDRPDDQDNEPEWKAHQTAERVIQESGVHVKHVRGDRAFYNMQTDKVTLPEREQMATANGYYQIALHELGHATGHPLRMDRDTLKNGAGNFGSVEYAREELRVEMSAMLTGACVGVGHDGSRGAAYVEGWIAALDHDPRENLQGRRRRPTHLRLPHAADPRPRTGDRAGTSRAGGEILGRGAVRRSARADGATAGPAPAHARGCRPWTSRG